MLFFTTLLSVLNIGCMTPATGQNRLQVTLIKLHLIVSSAGPGQCSLGSLAQAVAAFLVDTFIFPRPPLTVFTAAMFSLALGHIDHSAILSLIIGW